MNFEERFIHDYARPLKVYEYRERYLQDTGMTLQSTGNVLHHRGLVQRNEQLWWFLPGGSDPCSVGNELQQSIERKSVRFSSKVARTRDQRPDLDRRERQALPFGRMQRAGFQA